MLLFLALYFWVVVSCSVLKICKMTKVKIDFKIIWYCRKLYILLSKLKDDIMELQEAVNRSKDTYGRYEYSDTIDSSAGLGEITELGVVGIPSWDRLGRGKTRKVMLEIRTFCGISSDAIHCYGKLVVDGVYTATIGNLDKPKGITDAEELRYPFLNYSYQFKITRPLTRFEIDTQPDRWYCAEEGDLVEGYETMAALIADTTEIFKLRFTGIWDFYVQYPNGKRELIDLK